MSSTALIPAKARPPTAPGRQQAKAPARAQGGADAKTAAVGQRGAITPARNEAIPEEAEAAVDACRAAARDCAFVIMGFFHIAPDALFKSTRGAAAESFPRQILMAGLKDGLGFSPLTVGRAVGRDKATVEHACRVVEAFRAEAEVGGMDVDDLVDILGVAAVDDFLGGVHGAEEFLKHCDGLVERFFAAFQLVAVFGGAYREDLERRRTEQESGR